MLARFGQPVLAILNDEKRLLPCACFLNGQYGFEGVYMGVPAVLGATGVENIVELPLGTEARIQMQKTAGAIEADLANGRRPFLINANAGTTNTGAIDPLAGLSHQQLVC